ncbi:hypothetical protein, partial [Neptunomonas phycophila]|uniref:hypothetical protein n=1 Tax=Neptunomonas phycophila TaxID=1572645 RepID=UPI001C3761E2
ELAEGEQQESRRIGIEEKSMGEWATRRGEAAGREKTKRWPRGRREGEEEDGNERRKDQGGRKEERGKRDVRKTRKRRKER